MVEVIEKTDGTPIAVGVTMNGVLSVKEARAFANEILNAAWKVAKTTNDPPLTAA